MPRYICEVKDCEQSAVAVMQKDGAHLVCQEHKEKWAA